MIRDNFFVLIILTISTIMPADANLSLYLGIIFAIALGMMLRVGVQLRNKTFSWFGLLIQIFITVPVCYGAYNFWLAYDLDFQLQLFLFLVSFMALFIAKIIDSTFREWVQQFGQSLLKRVQAEEKQEDKE